MDGRAHVAGAPSKLGLALIASALFVGAHANFDGIAVQVFQ
jgi:hypothetical protein